MAVLAAIGEERSPNPVVSKAYDLASAYGDELIVLHVVPEEEFDRYKEEIGRLTEFEDYSFAQEAESAARFADRIVESTLDSYDRDRVSTTGRVGNPVESILDVAEEVDARYLVIGGRRRTPTGKAIFGSATQSILLNADRPVVTVMTEE